MNNPSQSALIYVTRPRTAIASSVIQHERNKNEEKFKKKKKKKRKTTTVKKKKEEGLESCKEE